MIKININFGKIIAVVSAIIGVLNRDPYAIGFAIVFGIISVGRIE